MEAPEVRAIPKNKHRERLTPAIQLRHISRDLTCNKDNVYFSITFGLAKSLNMCFELKIGRCGENIILIIKMCNK